MTDIAPGMAETEFSVVRLGSEEKAKAVYAGMRPLTAQDIADVVVWVATRPAHVNISEVVLTPTDQAGQFVFATVKPGSVPGPHGRAQAPHINVGLFARGLLKRLFTRIYFAGEAMNAADPILALVPPERRHTLLARPDPGRAGVFRFDIRLQGQDETVFFDA